MILILLVAIVAEVMGRMVLLIPDAVRNLIRKGRREQHDRINEAWKLFGVEVDGVRMLPDTPEVREFLDMDKKDK